MLLVLQQVPGDETNVHGSRGVAMICLLAIVALMQAKTFALGANER